MIYLVVKEVHGYGNLYVIEILLRSLHKNRSLLHQRASQKESMPENLELLDNQKLP